MDDTLRRIVGVISEESPAVRVVLFGSGARGDAGPQSDLDLLVVVPDGVHRRRTAQDLYERLRGIPASMDLVVVTLGDVARHLKSPGLILATELEEGVDLYAAA